MSLFDVEPSEQLPPAASPDASPPADGSVPSTVERPTGWYGISWLAEHRTPLTSLEFSCDYDDDVIARFMKTLSEDGQQRPVLTASNNRTVVARAHLCEAARRLGWSHIAAKNEVTEIVSDVDQLTLAEMVDNVEAFKPKDMSVENEAEVEDLNELSSDPNAGWVGLPEWERADKLFLLNIGCETAEDRDAIADLLGLRTLMKGTRGTWSMRWPDRGREKLTALRFDFEDEL